MGLVYFFKPGAGSGIVMSTSPRLYFRGGNRAGRAGLGRANSGPGQNWPGFFGPRF